ncbi:MAG: copper chaperone PCu(A)C [Reyranella sp.]|nr:copper chaperone PCu(A)C [Reyranella sp.]
MRSIRAGAVSCPAPFWSPRTATAPCCRGLPICRRCANGWTPSRASTTRARRFVLSRRFRLLSLLALLLVAAPAIAHDYKLGALQIGNPWARATPPTAPSGGGFLSITNTGTTPDRLVSAKSPAADMVQVHEMKMDGNVMRMREIEKGLEIAPGATVTLAPGGLHLMMMGLKAPFKQGEKVPVTLTFEKAGKIDVELVVVPIGATPGQHEHKQ